MRKTIAVAMIVKNEEDLLARCLESVKEADAIYICDTGSVDRTIEIARQYTENVYLDFIWQGPPLSMERLERWKDDAVQTEGTRLPLTLGQAIERHDGELIPWKPNRNVDNLTGLSVMLPALASPPAGHKRSAAVLSSITAWGTGG